MKICAISDIHGNLIEVPKCDVLCICGDIFPLEIQKNPTECHEWFFSEFLPWAEACPCEQVYYIAGNHDFFFESFNAKRGNSDKVVYLENDLIEYKGVRFYGTPYCQQCSIWAFTQSPRELKAIFNKIPYDVDVLLTHDAPYGVSDICLEPTPWNTGEHIGNPQLEEAIIEKKPTFNLHGHLHSANHNYEMLGNTKVYNVSIKNEKYKISYNPLIIEI